VEPRAHHILIGLFTLTLTAVAIGFTLWLGKSSVDKDGHQYDIVFTESVTGLAVGNDVLYNGIRMGEVESLRLDQQDPGKVWARIRVSQATPVTEDTTARLTIANITGAAVIQLISGTPGSPPLTLRSGKIPVIEASPSPFRQLRTSSEELLANITNLVSNARDILSEENTARIKRILADLEVTTSAVAEEKASIGEAIKALSASAQELPQTLATATALLQKVNTAMDEKGEVVVQDLQRTMRSTEKLATNLDNLIKSNQTAVSQSLSEVGPLLHELRQTINNLGQITQRLEEDPSGFILGNEKVREYQP
jgi:phospholipid/cholesterol/gamma-HCH transport system substrate-binding protein